MADITPTSEEAFQTATKESKQLLAAPNNDELLSLYGKFILHAPHVCVSFFANTPPTNVLQGLYKVGTGADLDKADKPGMFDLRVSPLRTFPPQYASQSCADLCFPRRRARPR